MFRLLLVPIDGSAASLEAVDAAIGIARAQKAGIHVFHAVPSFPSMAYLAGLIHATRALYEEEASARAIQWLDEARERVLGAGLPCSVSYVFAARAHEAIAEAAQQYACDLIVMASPLRYGVLPGMFARETQAVMQSVGIPVLAWR